MLCPAAALVLLLQHHGQAAHVFVILAIPYLIDMPRIDLGACFTPSGCLLLVTKCSNRPKVVTHRPQNWERFRILIAVISMCEPHLLKTNRNF